MERRLQERGSGWALIVIALYAEVCLAIAATSPEAALTTGPAMDQTAGSEPYNTQTDQYTPSARLWPNPGGGGRSKGLTTEHSAAQTAPPPGDQGVSGTGIDSGMETRETSAPGSANETKLQPADQGGTVTARGGRGGSEVPTGGDGNGGGSPGKYVTNANENATVAPGLATETTASGSLSEYGTIGATGNGAGSGTEGGTIGGTEGGAIGGTEGGTIGGTEGPIGGTEGETIGGTEGPIGGTEGGNIGGTEGGAIGGTEDGTGGRTDGGSVSHSTSAPSDESPDPNPGGNGNHTISGRNGTGLENTNVTENYTTPSSLGDTTKNYTTPSSFGNTTKNYTRSSSLGNTTENGTFISSNTRICCECHGSECENLTTARTCQSAANTCYILYDLEISAVTLGCAPLISTSEVCADEYLRAATYCEYCCKTPDHCNDFSKLKINLKAWCTGENGGAIISGGHLGAVWVFSTAMFLLGAMENV